MTGRSKRKGDTGEREVVDFLTRLCMDAQRVPLSGAAGGMFTADVHFRNPNAKTKEVWNVEVKRRGKDAFKTDYKWLQGADMTFKRADNQEWLVTMRADDLSLFLNYCASLFLHGIEIEVV